MGDLGTRAAFVSNPSKPKEINGNQSEPVIALRAEFVLKPGNESKVRETIEMVMANSFFRDRQFLHALVLISEMESRLVTVLTFWETDGFAEARERRVVRMRQKLQPFLDQSMRVQSFTAHTIEARTVLPANQIAGAEQSLCATTNEMAVA